MSQRWHQDQKTGSGEHIYDLDKFLVNSLPRESHCWHLGLMTTRQGSPPTGKQQRTPATWKWWKAVLCQPLEFRPLQVTSGWKDSFLLHYRRNKVCICCHLVILMAARSDCCAVDFPCKHSDSPGEDVWWCSGGTIAQEQI